MTLLQHPLSDAFPAMSLEDFQALKDDIEVTGQREPVIVLDGMVLDGWHRYRACSELGLPVVKFTFKDGEDPVAFVLSHNLHRRHLSESQRAAAVVACTSWAPPNRLKNKQATVPASSKTNAEMAKVAGTSERTVKDAKTAQRAGLIDEVKDGTISASGAAKIARGEPPKPEKKTAVQPIDDGPSAAEVAASERAAAEEFDALRKIALSDDKLAALLEENKQLRAMNRVLTERNNGLLNEKSELVKRVKSLQRKLEQPA